MSGFPDAAAAAARMAASNGSVWGTPGSVDVSVEDVVAVVDVATPVVEAVEISKRGLAPAGVLVATVVMGAPPRLVTKLTRLFGGAPLVSAKGPMPVGCPGMRPATGITERIEKGRP